MTGRTNNTVATIRLARELAAIQAETDRQKPRRQVPPLSAGIRMAVYGPNPTPRQLRRIAKKHARQTRVG